MEGKEDKLDVKPLDKPELSKKDKLEILREQIKAYDNFPTYAMTGFVTHYDLLSVLILLESLFDD